MNKREKTYSLLVGDRQGLHWYSFEHSRGLVVRHSNHEMMRQHVRKWDPDTGDGDKSYAIGLVQDRGARPRAPNWKHLVEALEWAHDQQQEVIGSSIQDGRWDVAQALVTVIRGGGRRWGHDEALFNLALRIRDDPYDGIKEALTGPQLLERSKDEPIPMLLYCPECGKRHIDEGDFATKSHHTHACQNCGACWRPAIVPTCGVQFLPGYKNL